MLPVHYLYISGSESGTELKLRNTHSVNKTPFNFHFNFHILFNCRGSGWKAATAKALCIHLIELYELKHLIHFSAHCRWQEGNREPPSNRFPSLQVHVNVMAARRQLRLTLQWLLPDFPHCFSLSLQIYIQGTATREWRCWTFNSRNYWLSSWRPSPAPFFALNVIDWLGDGFENHRPIDKGTTQSLSLHFSLLFSHFLSA